MPIFVLSQNEPYSKHFEVRQLLPGLLQSSYSDGAFVGRDPAVSSRAIEAKLCDRACRAQEYEIDMGEVCFSECHLI